jgi:hypothetical protein
MKTLRFLVFAVLALGMVVGCSKDEGLQEKPELTGTQWKLSALVNVQTGGLIEPEPKACDKCYTLAFDSDSTATGQSVLNRLHFSVTPSNIEMYMMTEMWDGENNNVALFYDALLTIDAYEYNNRELKIYYDNRSKYLSYKRLLQ